MRYGSKQSRSDIYLEYIKSALRLFNSKYFIIILAFLSFLTVFYLFRFIYNPRGNVLPSEWTVENASDSATGGDTVTIPFSKLHSSPMHLIISSNVSWKKNDILVIPKISGNILIVYVDGLQIFQKGGYDKTGNIWSEFNWIRLPSGDSLKKITIEIYGLYDLGIEERIYIIPEKENNLVLFLSDVLVTHFYWVSLGASFILVFILTLYSLVASSLRKSYILTAIGIFLFGVYSMEFSFRESSGSVGNMILMKKIFMISGYAGSWFLVSGMEWFVSRKIQFSKYLAAITLLCISALFLSSNLYELKNLNNYAIGILILNWIFIFYFAYVNNLKVVIFAISLFLFTALYSFINTIFLLSPIYFFQISFMSVHVALSFNIMHEYFRVHDAFVSIYEKSRLDPLTGAYNRSVIEDIKYSDDDLVVVVDMNNFKQMNDTYGHDFGDGILREWVLCAKENTRKEDFVIRLGGDEFVIILRGNNAEAINRISTNFRKKMRDLPVSFSFGIEKIDGSLEDAINRADASMFESKKGELKDYSI